MYNPVSTYRIQFHKDFTFAKLEAAIPYLIQLGIKTLYASPIFEAVPGSTHGYDGINPHRINPEIGTEEELRRISARLREAGIGWLQDIVPNHMAFDPRNAWLMDVLEKGKASEFANYFDILWDDNEKMMVPFLGGILEEVVEKGELEVKEQEGKWYFDYFDNLYPINPATNPKADLSGAALLQLAKSQPYRLCHWQETDRRINYRRFFTVNGLICLNIQDDKVFEHYHRYIAQLYKEGVFTGLRIDHIDGLYNPEKYLDDLRGLVGEDAYIVVEKILQPEESLPKTWPIQGNTGYDFLSLVNNLLTRETSERALSKLYEKLTDDRETLEQQLRDKKAHVLYSHMRGELDNLTELFRELLPKGKSAPASLKLAIGEILIQCPVYRYYGASMPLPEEDAAALNDIFKRVRSAKPELREGTRILQEALLERPNEGDAVYNAKALHFYQRLMQFSGPLMAKGVEDTLMYTYNRFIGHNDVGDSPEGFGLTREAFHKAMLERQSCWPLTLNATSTHDTKRGEDARAILRVISAAPEKWIAAVLEWTAMNASLKQSGTPDAQDEYFIYQTLFGTYPFDEADAADYPDRLTEYLQKALREGKRKSDWAEPDEAYENAVKEFALALLKQDTPFWNSFIAFRESMQDCGIVQALAQVAIRFTSPGVPDTYQGTEFWDQSMVDPDNRRPVDYEKRAKKLAAYVGTQHGAFLQDLWTTRNSGEIKQALIYQLLKLRADNAELFQKGQYIPLRVTGRHKENVVAYARQYGNRWIIVAAPLYLAALRKAPLEIDWKDTAIQLPLQAPQSWQHMLQQGQGKAQGELLAKDIFSGFPLAILQLDKQASERSAGVLMPITSLPSPYRIGDLGPEARRFAKQLSRAGQSYWQVLPLNPISSGSNYSPYSSISTMAGNSLLISPDLLVQEGLLREEEVASFRKASGNKVDYAAAEQTKCAILDIAWQRYKSSGFRSMKRAVDVYREQEASWLQDFALFLAIRHAQDGKPWYEWDDAFRLRDADAFKRFATENSEAIERVIWEQYIFSHQWQLLRAWCNSLGIKLFGDLPFYASYDSADVWTHPEIFSLDESGKMAGVAGVPPDYFSETGQLWGMPTFKWDVLKTDGYRWWIERLRKNLQLYDVLRIDHFRALAAYWEVPAGEETAVNGKWIDGPGTDFFDAVREVFGGLPFIAEDLGDNMADVYKLRDAVGLPGMKVVQFAFGDNLPTSVDVPHNYGKNFVCYTGTHDNNTTLGWFRQEVKDADKKRMAFYTNTDVTQKNVNKIMAKLAYGSVARIAILPMQDVLHLDEGARMNTPGAGEGNWGWRMKPDAFTDERIKWLWKMAKVYNRL